MDPDANLNEQMRWSRRLIEDDFNSDSERCTAGVRLAELVDSLNTWLVYQGFLPAAWDHERRFK